MLLSDVFALLTKFAIIDFIIDGILIGSACAIKYSFFSDNFVPFISTDIENSLSTETFSYWSLCIVTFGVGLAIVVGFWLITYFDSGCFRAAASYIFSIGAAMLICSALAKFIGRPRPDTLTLCGGDGSYKTCQSILGKSDLAMQFASFPCTEAAEAMAAAIFISLYLSELITSYNNFTSLITSIPIFAAFFVASACIWDRKNHVDDVVAGLVVGALSGLVAFRTFKKSLKEKKLERRPGAQTETSSLPMPKYN